MSTVDIINATKEALEEKNSSIGNTILGEPRINVISKEEYENRVEKVFHILWEVLAKSFGPYGAPTLICNYPWTHVTKDGYTIMKNLSMDTSKTLVDQQIADMASDICGRLNYSVGDGTTSAVIATNSIYQSYRLKKSILDGLSILPRDVIKRYDDIKNRIVTRLLNDYVEKPDLTDRDNLAEIIRKVVYISSNGDDTITDYISDLYRELGCPAITCSLAPDGITKKQVVHGYKFEMSLIDRLYINSDDGVMWLQEADFIIFSTKVNEETYENILKPLNDACRVRGRRLVVAAPSYDERMLSQSIKRDLNNEWAKTKKINMVLTVYRATSEHARRLVEDFAVLVNTIVIDRPMLARLLTDVHKTSSIEKVFNIDARDGIPDIMIGTCPSNLIKEGRDFGPTGIMRTINGKAPKNYSPITMIDDCVRIGYARDIKIGLTHTVVEDLYYNEDTYNAILKESKSLLDETRKKYQKLGTFNLAVTQAEQRHYALNLLMGSIEVGADSELSQKMLKDAVDDSIKAAASAYYHGVLTGCNTVLIRIIGDMLKEDDLTAGDRVLLEILHKGFIDVYKTVLRNAFTDYTVEFPDVNDLTYEQIEVSIPSREANPNRFSGADEAIFDVIRELSEKSENGFVSIHDLIVEYSVRTGTVFDLSTMTFSKDIINSAQTDIEILKATIDLITILIVGNQMVVTQKHNFE